MKYDRILVRYGDLTLKGRNRKMFQQKLENLIRRKLSHLNVTIDTLYDRAYVNLKDENVDEVIKGLDKVSGLSSYSLVVKANLDMEDIKNKSLELVKTIVTEETTFKVETRRGNKQFPLTSPEITKEVAGYVLGNTDNLIVNVNNPSLVLNVDIRKDASYLYTGSIKGMGGFPVGVAGEGLLMISGGIDSPVAGYLSQKQGVEVSCIHFESTPLTSIESVQKVVDLTKVLAEYSQKDKVKLFLVPFVDMHKSLMENIPESYWVTIMRRMMYRIAEGVAKKGNIKLLINGESLGQVASQTIESMYCVNNVTNMPIVRPLATYDKTDIIKISRKIDAYETSIKPFEDCCTIYLPKNPTTMPSLDKCLDFEKKFNFEELVNKCIEDTKVIYIKKNSDLELSLYGFSVDESLENYKMEKSTSE